MSFIMAGSRHHLKILDDFIACSLSLLNLADTLLQVHLLVAHYLGVHLLTEPNSGQALIPMLLH